MEEPQTLRPSFHGTGGALFVIQFVNALLTVLTLGIYNFWGRTRVRRYIWSQTAFEGDRFTYHGTGGELLKGYLMGMALLFGLGAVLSVLGTLLGQEANAVSALGMVLLWMVIMASLVGVAQVGARRYRLSRTSWRGIRFSFRGSIGEFIGIQIPGILLSVITLGLYIPFLQCRVRRFFAENTRFGTGRFAFYGEGKDLIGPFVLAVLLTIPTLGIYWFWYNAFRDRYYWGNTYFEDASFHSTVTGGALFGLAATNLLLIIFTVGIAVPWVLVRTRRFVADRVVMEGTVDLSAIVQDARLAAATGEGVGEILDLGGGLDMGGGF